MRDDLVNNGMLEQKSKKKVIEIIGLPDYSSDTSNIWRYDLGMSGAGLGFQFNTLHITFENDRVV